MTDHTQFIENAQRDGRLLLRFITRLSKHTLPPAARAGAAFDILFEPADAILQSGKLDKLTRCVDALSQQALPANVRTIRMTAAVLNIPDEDGEPPDNLKNTAWWLRWLMLGIAIFAVLLLVIAILLLAHMDSGRRLLQQLVVMRSQEQAIRHDIAALLPADTWTRSIDIRRIAIGPFLGQATRQLGHTPLRAAGGRQLGNGRLAADDETVPVSDQTQMAIDSAVTTAPAAPAPADGVVFSCGPPPYGMTNSDGITIGGNASGAPGLFHLGRAVLSWREPITQKALDLCQRYDDNRVRLAVLYTGIADWNCLTHAIFGGGYGRLLVGRWWWSGLELDPSQASDAHRNVCGNPTSRVPPEIDLMAWRSHETWVGVTTAVVAGFLLPLLLGCLGGCAYVLRRVDGKITSWTLELADGRHAVSRVALAALLGGLVGVFWTSGDTVKLGGYTLSLAAVAFFVGFSVEGVFKVIEAIIFNLTASASSTARPPSTGN
jgi:hypothetical protein